MVVCIARLVLYLLPLIEHYRAYLFACQ